MGPSCTRPPGQTPSRPKGSNHGPGGVREPIARWRLSRSCSPFERRYWGVGSSYPARSRLASVHAPAPVTRCKRGPEP